METVQKLKDQLNIQLGNLVILEQYLEMDDSSNFYVLEKIEEFKKQIVETLSND